MLAWASEKLDDSGTCVFTDIEGCLDEDTIGTLNNVVLDLHRKTVIGIETKVGIAYEEMS